MRRTFSFLDSPSVRHPLGPRLIKAARRQVELAQAIEVEYKKVTQSILDSEQEMYLIYVVGAITQACFAVEAFRWEFAKYEVLLPVSADPIPNNGKAKFQCLKESKERQSIGHHFEDVSIELGQGPFDFGSTELQDLKFAFTLRNELVHFKSLTDKEEEEMKPHMYLKKFQNDRKFEHAPWIQQPAVFPHNIVAASVANHVVSSCEHFLNWFLQHTSSSLKQPEIWRAYHTN